MELLGSAITEAIVDAYGTSEFLARISNPYWFQALGSVMGMDWHSSGITTSVVGALKRGLAPRANELGLWVCGGRGRHSRNTPAELRLIDNALATMAERYAKTAHAADRTRVLAQMLDEQRELLRHVSALRVADATGEVLTPGEAPLTAPIRLGDRSYFDRARARDATVVSEPLRCRVTGEWCIVAARRLINADGQFDDDPSTSGRTARARAIETRWRWPPDSSCGRLRANCSAGVKLTRSSSVSTSACTSALLRFGPCRRSGRAMWCSTVWIGFSEANGSWKIIWTWRR